MRPLLRLILIGWLFLLMLPAAGRSQLTAFLESIDAKEIRQLPGEGIHDTIIEFMIEQPLDHRNPEGPAFLQKLYIAHIDPDLPVVFNTEGYAASYFYSTELARELNCNQITAEHRYFGNSVPDSVDWTYLDTWQAASDHHRIVEYFREFYNTKWIGTGISKGGQTVMYHAYYYPEDIEIRVPYVAPLNFSIEDERIYDFLDNVGSGKERRKIRRFQKMTLKNQEKYLPAFREISDRESYSYEIAGGTEAAFEYCILEYSFAYWQWAYADVSEIPGPSEKPMEVVKHLDRVSGFDYFADSEIRKSRPFFYQALTEMGYYGYRLEDFSRWIRHVEVNVSTFTLPQGDDLEFNPEISREVEHYLAKKGNNFIFIYGENDTWSATRVSDTGVTNSRIYIKEGGSHRSRINNMPPEQKNEVYGYIRSLL